MLSGEGNEKGENTTIGPISRKSNFFYKCSTGTFYVHFFVVVLHDYNVKLPETSPLHDLWRKCRTIFFFFFFFHYRSFHPGFR